MMLHAWTSYEKHAWGRNELRPLSRHGFDSNIFGSIPLGATIIDSLDTLHLMGLNEQFDKARNWVQNSFHLDIVRFLVINSFLRVWKRMSQFPFTTTLDASIPLLTFKTIATRQLSINRFIDIYKSYIPFSSIP